MLQLLNRLLVPIVTLTLLGFSSSATAAIKKPLPLKDVLEQEQIIVVAAVEKSAPDGPSLTFKITEPLKGKAPVTTLTVNMNGDAEAQKLKHAAIMFERLTVGRKCVLFISSVDDGFSCFAFCEGTWLQIQGTKDGAGFRWAFLHGEPYLRRTFAGTTAELMTTVTDCLAGKRQPPPWNAKEPPGYGPVPKSDKPNPSPEAKPTPIANAGLPLFGVIPSFVLLGPLALIAAIFPGVFARLAMAYTQWRVFLIVASTISTLALAYYWLRDFGLLPDTRWASQNAFNIGLVILTAIGLVWSWRRTVVVTEPAMGSPRNELLVIVGVNVLSLVILGVTALIVDWNYMCEIPWHTFTAIVAGITAAMLSKLYHAGQISDTTLTSTPILPHETVGIAGILFTLLAIVLFYRSEFSEPRFVLDGQASRAPFATKLIDSEILFETTDMHEVLSGITVTGQRLVFGTSKASGFRQTGAVYCIDRTTGQTVWKFNDGGHLKPVFSTPAVADGRVFTGEGLHTDAFRNFFCLNANTGKAAWPQPVTTGSHTEGSPRVVEGNVIFSAGDDGVYCVDAATGAQRWHVPGGPDAKLHIDTPPAVDNDKVFVGSGYRSWCLLALDAKTGREIWRTAVPMRSFSAPVASEDRVYFALGTGNIVDAINAEPDDDLPPEAEPHGAIYCLDTTTGQIVWKFDVEKPIHTNIVVDLATIYATCQNGVVYAIAKSDGRLRWKQKLGTSFACGPVLNDDPRSTPRELYAVTRDGMVACMNPHDGTIFWTRDLKAQTQRDVQVFSTPVVVERDNAGTVRDLYIGGMVTNVNNRAKSAVIFRITDSRQD